MKRIVISIACLFMLSSFDTTIVRKLVANTGGVYSIGDELPNIKFDNLVNASKSHISLNDLKGKLVILDFWGLWCPPCVKALPKLDSLQRLYGNKIAIIPIDGKQAGDNRAKVLHYFKLHGFILPSVVEDSVLLKMFPHKIVPHDVWIDKNGKVIATTDADEVNEINIQTILDGRKFAGKLKVDIVNFDIKQPLYLKGNVGECDSFLFRSLLTGYIDGLGGSTRQTPIFNDGKVYIRSFQAINSSGIMLFARVLDLSQSDGLLRPTRILLLKGDSLYNPNDFTRKKSIWKTFPKYCYSLDIPKEVPDTLFYRKYLLEDLNRYFDTDAKIEKKSIPTVVFRLDTAKWNSSAETINQSRNEDVKYSNIEGDYLDSIINTPFKEIVEYLNEFYLGAEPIVDETGLNDTRLSLALHLKFRLDEADRLKVNLLEWQSAFAKYGVTVSMEQRTTEVLVLKDVWTDSR